jgi:hypothetical protein
MTTESVSAAWFVTGFQTTVALWAWVLIVLLHCIFRLWSSPGADPIRESGPGA